MPPRIKFELLVTQTQLEEQFGKHYHTLAYRAFQTRVDKKKGQNPLEHLEKDGGTRNVPFTSSKSFMKELLGFDGNASQFSAVHKDQIEELMTELKPQYGGNIRFVFKDNRDVVEAERAGISREPTVKQAAEHAAAKNQASKNSPKYRNSERKYETRTGPGWIAPSKVANGLARSPSIVPHAADGQEIDDSEHVGRDDDVKTRKESIGNKEAAVSDAHQSTSPTEEARVAELTGSGDGQRRVSVNIQEMPGISNEYRAPERRVDVFQLLAKQALEKLPSHVKQALEKRANLSKVHARAIARSNEKRKTPPTPSQNIDDVAKVLRFELKKWALNPSRPLSAGDFQSGTQAVSLLASVLSKMLEAPVRLTLTRGAGNDTQRSGRVSGDGLIEKNVNVGNYDAKPRRNGYHFELHDSALLIENIQAEFRKLEL